MNRIHICICHILLFCCLRPHTGNTAPGSEVQRASAGLEIGNWQPHSLNDEPRFTDFGAAGATPFWGLSVCFPLKSGLGLRFSADYWALRDLEESQHVHSLTVHPLCVDLKYWLIPEYWLSAFVMYGGGRVLGCGKRDRSAWGPALQSEGRMGRQSGRRRGSGFFETIRAGPASAVSFRTVPRTGRRGGGFQRAQDRG